MNRPGWMRRRAHGQQIHHHGFAIGIPAPAAETILRHPIHGDRLAAIQRPFPVNPVVNIGGVAVDVQVAKIFAAGQHTAEQDRCINGRNLECTARLPLTGLTKW